MQIVVSHWPCDYIRDQHGEENCHSNSRTMSRVRAPNTLRRADFLGAALRGERGDAEKAEAGNEDGNAREETSITPCFSSDANRSRRSRQKMPLIAAPRHEKNARSYRYGERLGNLAAA